MCILSASSSPGPSGMKKKIYAYDGQANSLSGGGVPICKPHPTGNYATQNSTPCHETRYVSSYSSTTALRSKQESNTRAHGNKISSFGSLQFKNKNETKMNHERDWPRRKCPIASRRRLDRSGIFRMHVHSPAIWHIRYPEASLKGRVLNAIRFDCPTPLPCCPAGCQSYYFLRIR